MTAAEQRAFELKAAALLWRSPLAEFDPASEQAHQQRVLPWLQQQGIELTDDDLALLEACAEEAQDAALGLSSPPAGDGDSSSTLLHPLSAESIRPPESLKSAWRDRRLFLNRVPERNGDDVARWYLRLWRMLMREPLFRELPAHAVLRDHSVAVHRSMTAALVGARYQGGQPAFLALHVGPVQSFIAAARRTHDLAIGSYTVGYLAFAGAVALAKDLGPDVLLNPDVSCRTLADKLLFDDVIESGDKATLLRAALMNRVLAVVPASESDRLATLMSTTASETWHAMGRAAVSAGAGELDEQGFLRQLEQHLEIDLVAMPWPESIAELRALLRDTGQPNPAWLDSERARRPSAAFGLLADMAERVLAAHRSAVQPTGVEGDQRPKCTNCGVREQLGPITERAGDQQRTSREFSERFSRTLQQRESPGDVQAVRASLQLTRGEGLCAVCLTKRLATEEYYGGVSRLGLSWNNDNDRVLLRFPSTATFASAPFRFMLLNPDLLPSHPEVSSPAHRDEAWERARNAWANALEVAQGPALLNFTPPGNLLEGLGELGRQSRFLNQEGTWFYDLSYVPLSAWRSHFSQDPTSVQDQSRLQSLTGPLRKASGALSELRRISGMSASEYYAVIVLDGDDMGKWKAGRHADSPTYRQLGASEGGDGKRPVHPALYTELSRRLALLNDDLHQTIAAHLGRLVYHGGDDVLAFVPLVTALPCLAAIRRVICAPEHLGHKVTVSAGLSVFHWKDPLASALHEAREAETRAKEAGKDGFGVSLNPRSGEQLSLVLPWRYPLKDTSPHQARNSETIDLIEAFLRAVPLGDRADGKGTPVTSGKAAYALRDELPALSNAALRDAFLHRVKRLLFGDAQGNLQADADALFRRLCPQAIVDLLLVVRFLSRQRGGIDPDLLLRAVRQKVAHAGTRDATDEQGAP